MGVPGGRAGVGGFSKSDTSFSKRGRHFLLQAPSLSKYLKAVELRCVRDEAHHIVGFLAVAEKNIEMLFIQPTVRGKGVGAALLKVAVEELGANKVDVNEANRQAVGFYEHAGFRTISRSELDSTGKPFPILHMELSEATATKQ